METQNISLIDVLNAEKAKTRKLKQLNNIRKALIKATQKEEDFYNIDQFCKKNHTILEAKDGENLNDFMSRIWDEKKEKGSDVSATFEKLHITTEDMRDVDDMHASALEELENREQNGATAAIWKGLEEATHKVLGHDFYLSYIMDKSIGIPKKDKNSPIDFNKIDAALALATFREEETFVILHSHTGAQFIPHSPNQSINDYMQNIWNAQTDTTPAFGVYGKLHISTQAPKTEKPFRDVNDMHASALEEAEARLSSKNNLLTPVWNGLKVAHHLNKRNVFFIEQMMKQPLSR